MCWLLSVYDGKLTATGGPVYAGSPPPHHKGVVVKLLVTGGAGYIGSVTSRLLLDAGHEVVVLDNLSTGFREAVAPDAPFVEKDIRDAAEVLTPEAGFDAVLHFAGLIAAGESMVKPEL